MTLWRPRLSPALPAAHGPDPERLLALSRQLTPEQARHVAVLTERGVTANSAALAEALEVHHFAPHPVTGELLPVSGTGGGLGSLIARIFGNAPKRGQHDGAGDKVPPGVKVTCRDEQTGPYRRVYSRPGYSFQRSAVFLPTDRGPDLYEEKSGESGDTAFIYVGGWGGRGGAVDAGFQHGRYMGREQDDWAPFFLIERPGGASAVTVSPQRQRSGDPWRLLAGQAADLSFWVSEEAGETVLSMTISGVTNIDREPASLTLRAPVDPRYRWDAAGGGNVLKRMTTIGQRRGHQNLASGSHLRGVRWEGSVIGTDAGNARPWLGAQTGGYCSFPDPKSPAGQRTDGAGAKWRVQYRDPGNETANVTLK